MKVGGGSRFILRTIMFCLLACLIFFVQNTCTIFCGTESNNCVIFELHSKACSIFFLFIKDQVARPLTPYVNHTPSSQNLKRAIFPGIAV